MRLARNAMVSTAWSWYVIRRLGGHNENTNCGWRHGNDHPLGCYIVRTAAPAGPTAATSGLSASGTPTAYGRAVTASLTAPLQELSSRVGARPPRPPWTLGPWALPAVPPLATSLFSLPSRPRGSPKASGPAAPRRTRDSPCLSNRLRHAYRYGAPIRQVASLRACPMGTCQ